MSTRDLTQEQLLYLIDFFEAGLTPYQASKVTGYSNFLVQKNYEIFGYKPKNHKKIKKSKIEELSNCYNKKLTISETAELTGCSYGTVQRYFIKCGHTPKKHLTTEQKLTLKELYETGTSPKDAATKLGCQTRSVLAEYKKMGFKPKKAKLLTKQQKANLETHFLDGLGPTEAAQKVRCSPATALKYFKKYGHESKQKIITDEQKFQLRKAYDTGYDFKQAAVIAQCSVSTSFRLYKQLGWKPIKNIEKSDKLIELFDREPFAKIIIENFGGDEADLADVLSVVYQNRLSLEDAVRFLAEPSIREYLGEFQRPETTLMELTDAFEKLQPFDREGIIRDIVFRKAIKYRREKLGPYPTEEQKTSFLRELQEQLVV